MKTLLLLLTLPAVCLTTLVPTQNVEPQERAQNVEQVESVVDGEWEWLI